MKVFKPLALGVLHRTVEFQRRFFLCFATTTFCPMGEAPGILGDIAMWKLLGEELPPTEPLDLVFPKTTGEFLVAARAYAPGGVPARSVPVSARLGTVTKRLMAVGDRHFEDQRPTDPAPFTEMALTWDRAYGGSKVAENPRGVGTEEKPLQGIGYRIPLPNVVSTDRSRTGPPEPVGFGPIDIAWPQRTKLAGTHDARWLEEEFPGFARDIDFRIFMAAQPDQRFPKFLDGIEDYAFENMHPTSPHITGRLPGLMPRVAIQRKGRTEFEDVSLGLSTVWFFPHRERLVMIHHGRIRVDEEDARDIDKLVLGCDYLGTLRPVEALAAVVAKRLDPERGLMETLRESDLVPAELIRPDPAEEADSARKAPRFLHQKRMRRRHELLIEQQRATMVANGIDPDIYGPKPLPPEEPELTLEEVPDRIERALREAEAEQKKAEAILAEEKARGEVEFPGMMPNTERKASGPPSFRASEERARLEAMATDIEAEGFDAATLRQLLADPSTMQRLVATEDAAREGYLQTAQEQDPAPALDAIRNAALLSRLIDGRRDAQRADLCGADLAGADLAGFDLSEAWLDGADLSRANLTRAKLGKAVLAHARLSGARLVGVDLKGANLGGAILDDADLGGADLTGAMLVKTDFSRASLRRVKLGGALMLETLLAGVDIADIEASGVLFLELSLAGMTAIGAKLDKAQFVKCNLTGANLSQADLAAAAFVSVTAAGLAACGADLSKTVFVEGCDLRGADFTGARCEATLFRGSNLSGAVFDGAILDGADFSDCDLTGASFDLARARNARFTVADLRGAKVTRADLQEASLARADLRGADLSDTSLYGVDLARIHADQATRYERVHRVRAKLVPRRIAP